MSMEHLEIAFKAPEWLQINKLTQENVLEYFTLSEFYDRTCNNEYIKMQTRFAGAGGGGGGSGGSQIDLINMTGIEYTTLQVPNPDYGVFVIIKQRRESPTRAIPIAYYYILEGTIYQAPTLYSILENRMTAASLHLLDALKESSQHARFDPWKGYFWADVQKDQKSEVASGSSTSVATASKNKIGKTEILLQPPIFDSLLGNLYKRPLFSEQVNSTPPTTPFVSNTISLVASKSLKLDEAKQQLINVPKPVAPLARSVLGTGGGAAPGTAAGTVSGPNVVLQQPLPSTPTTTTAAPIKRKREPAPAKGSTSTPHTPTGAGTPTNVAAPGPAPKKGKKK